MVLLVAGAACAAFLVVALCCTGWWFYTHDHHAGVTALGFYGYAAGTFALMGLVFYYHGKAADGS